MSRRPPLATVATMVRYTLVELSNRRYLWWISGVALALTMGLALVGSLFPLNGTLEPHAAARLFARGTAGLYVLVSIVVIGMNVVRPEIDSGAAALVLSRPVSRADYLLGRYAGNIVVVAGTVAIMGVGSFLVALADGVADWTLLYDFVTLAFNAAVVLAVMVLLAIELGTVAAAILGFLTYEVVGNIPLLVAVVHAKLVTGFSAALVWIFVAIMPHVLPSPLVNGQEVTLSGTTFVMRGPTILDLIWGLAWIAGSLALAVVELGRKEL